MTATDDADRRLARGVAVGLPLTGFASTVVTGLAVGFGPAILVLASTALLSTIALLWASLRTLSGDAPLPTALEASAGRRERADAPSEQKRQVLRALKDLEAERALGKIEEADYTELAARYREEAKSLMRGMEAEVAPALDEAEKVASEYLRARKPMGGTGKTPEKKDAPSSVPARRVECGTCSASNEADAAFCKGCGARLGGRGEDDARAKA
jgi:hypothetical protein